MAERPIFMSTPDSSELVREVFLQLNWNSGFARVQKEKNVKALHEAAAAAGLTPALEISTKSDKQRGQHLSAFYIKVKSQQFGEIPLECAFQGSKIFESGGPFNDLYRMEARDVKKDPRLRESGPLVAFEFDGFRWPLEPKTAFYDWLYINFLKDYSGWARKLFSYAGFTDIEFNPYRSVNCQARSCALFLALLRRNLLEEALQSPEDFIQLLLRFNYRPQLRDEKSRPQSLFAYHY